MLPYWCARYADSGLYNTFISPAHLITKQSDDFLNATYVETLDTTLRDGAQSVDVSFTPKDKIRIAIALDELGVDYIEGGWPGSNPKDSLFFERNKRAQTDQFKAHSIWKHYAQGQKSFRRPESQFHNRLWCWRCYDFWQVVASSCEQHTESQQAR